MLCKGSFTILVYICAYIINSSPNKSAICLGRENATGKDKGLGFGGFLFGWGFEGFLSFFFHSKYSVKLEQKLLASQRLKKDLLAYLSVNKQIMKNLLIVFFPHGIKREA